MGVYGHPLPYTPLSGTQVIATVGRGGVPERATWTVMLIGAAGMGAMARRTRAASLVA
jgi:hypothetical protein